jgi:hypothetical protein
MLRSPALAPVLRDRVAEEVENLVHQKKNLFMRPPTGPGGTAFPAI